MDQVRVVLDEVLEVVHDLLVSFCQEFFFNLRFLDELGMFTIALLLCVILLTVKLLIFVVLAPHMIVLLFKKHVVSKGQSGERAIEAKSFHEV